MFKSTTFVPWSLTFSCLFAPHALEIQPEELKASLAKAGIHLSDADLIRFIKAMDKDGDGMIDYEEWRDFLVVRISSLRFVFTPRGSVKGRRPTNVRGQLDHG